MHIRLFRSLLIASIFGLTALGFTVMATLLMKSSDVGLLYAWKSTADAHAAFLIVANLFGFAYGWQDCKPKY